MTQEEFNAMLIAAKPTLKTLLQELLAEGLEGGYYTSKYSGEEMDALLDKISALPGARYEEELK